MSLGTDLMLAILAVVLIFIIYRYLETAEKEITNIKGYNKNTDLQSAITRISRAKKITLWFIIILFIAIIIFIFTIEFLAPLAKILIFLIFLIAIGIVIYDGIEAAMAANEIKKSGVSDNNGSYSTTIKIGAIGIATLVIIFIYIIFKITKSTKKQKQK